MNNINIHNVAAIHLSDIIAGSSYVTRKLLIVDDRGHRTQIDLFSENHDSLLSCSEEAFDRITINNYAHNFSDKGE